MRNTLLTLGLLVALPCCPPRPPPSSPAARGRDSHPDFAALGKSVVSLRMKKTGRWGEKEVVGCGTVVASSSGDTVLVLTCRHVVEGAADVRCVFADLGPSACFPAALLRVDESSDLALLGVRVPGSSRPAPVVLAASDPARGDPVWAVGHPRGYEHTVTHGVVSGTGRRVVLPNGPVGQETPLIQTDAAINPGNSGGPLVNDKGELVGLVCAIRTDSQGIAFALPVPALKDFLEK